MLNKSPIERIKIVDVFSSPALNSKYNMDQLLMGKINPPFSIPLEDAKDIKFFDSYEHFGSDKKAHIECEKYNGDNCFNDNQRQHIN